MRHHKSTNMKTLALLLVLLIATVGCSGGETELSKTEDKSMRDKMTQGLSPEEIEKYMGKEAADNFRNRNANSGPGAPPAPPKKGN